MQTIRDLAVRIYYTATWFVAGRQPLGITWKASGLFVERLRSGGFKVLR